MLREGQIVVGPQFSEPMVVETVRADGVDTWVVGLVGVSIDGRGAAGEVQDEESRVSGATTAQRAVPESVLSKGTR